MKNLTLVGSLALLISATIAQADMAPPGPPSDTADPGSLSYSCSFQTEHYSANGLEGDLFLPTSGSALVVSPVVVFGHGHMVGLWGYQATFEHLAKKCIAVIFPTYDSVSSSDFTQMGQTYLQVVNAVIQSHPASMNPAAVIFAGHSNGSRVALNAASLAQGQALTPKSLVLFSVPDYESNLIANIPADLPVTMVVGDQDASKIIRESDELYPLLPSQKKQYVTFKSYLQTTPQIIANHGMTRTSDFVSTNITPIHYYGVWKYLVSAAFFAQDGTMGDYIYGVQATTTGIPGFLHDIQRGFDSIDPISDNIRMPTRR
jgi:pimeloyl-ACP methyl ester carboxylesterase